MLDYVNMKRENIHADLWSGTAKHCTDKRPHNGLACLAAANYDHEEQENKQNNFRENHPDCADKPDEKC